jgi:hypothetical protein
MTVLRAVTADYLDEGCPVCQTTTCEDLSHQPPTNGPETAQPTLRAVPKLTGFTLDALTDHRFPDRKALFMRGDTVVFREGHLGQVYAERGIGKTWCLQSLSLAAASGSEALGFRAPAPCRVLYVDGEMASREIQDRFDLLRDRLRIARSAALTIVAADWQEQFLARLDTVAGQAALESFVDVADLIVLDNRSCLFDPEGEKDPVAWQAAQDWLLSLRRRGKGVLTAHHSNRQGGARGHSKAEDPMNLLIRLSRPEDYSIDQGARFMVTFDKCRGAYGAEIAPFLAHLTVDGWAVSHLCASNVADKLLAYVRLAEAAGERPTSANAAISRVGVNRNQGLEAWRALLNRGAICKHPEGGFHAQ